VDAFDQDLESPESPYSVVDRFLLDDEVRTRLDLVSGSTNYSIVLRNSEHFARYIFGGRWISTQLLPGEAIHDMFAHNMPQSASALINTVLPCELERLSVIKPMYKLQKSFVDYEKGNSSTDLNREDAFNILMLGPTGCGKSHLINLLFNKTVAKSAARVRSVTEHVTIYSGIANIYREPRFVNLIDTIGFCDTQLTPTQVQRMIRESVKNNFIYLDKIVFLCSGRIEPGHKSAIQKFMEWFKYHAYGNNFVLVYGRCDGLSQEDRQQGIMDACSVLGFTSNQQRIIKPDLVPSRVLSDEKEIQIISFQIATAFPPGAPYSAISTDLYALVDAVFTPYYAAGEPVRIPARKEECLIL